jgi:hypothetical protein
MNESERNEAKGQFQTKVFGNWFLLTPFHPCLVRKSNLRMIFRHFYYLSQHAKTMVYLRFLFNLPGIGSELGILFVSLHILFRCSNRPQCLFELKRNIDADNIVIKVVTQNKSGLATDLKTGNIGN